MRSYACGCQTRKWGVLREGPVLARRSRWIFSGSAAATLLLALTGCAPQLPEKTPAASPLPARTSATASASALSDLQASVPAKTAASVAVAVTAAQRFCRPGLSQSRWMAALSPLLTMDAASVYATVDPARVQCSKVVPPAHAVEGDGFTRVVTVQTDRSPYRVVLSRSSLSAPWLVFRIARADEK